jgi:hypothetical protein
VCAHLYALGYQYSYLRGDLIAKGALTPPFQPVTFFPPYHDLVNVCISVDCCLSSRLSVRGGYRLANFGSSASFTEKLTPNYHFTAPAISRPTADKLTSNNDAE